MKIGIMGMGYVGAVSAACLARDGHFIVGIDPIQSKVDDLNAGRSPIQEPGVAELILNAHKAGRLTATPSPSSGLEDVDMVWVCVGTPSGPDGGINLSSLEVAVRDIGVHIRQSGTAPSVVIRSTLLPGTMNSIVVPLLEETSGLRVGRGLELSFHPEFLREGSSVADFDQPPKIVVGEAFPGSADRLLSLYDERYSAPRFRVGLTESELVKYYDNVFHAVKITFTNEMASVARAAGADARKVAEIFCSDTKLNVSSAYLRPGFAFGGSCLPKDLRAVLRHAALQSLHLPMLNQVLPSNHAQIQRVVQRLIAKNPVRVGLVGLAFKPHTDDMRESPYIAVAKALLGEGVQLRIFDRTINPARLIGSNQMAVLSSLRHLEEYLVPDLEGLSDCSAILINHASVDASRVQRWTEAGIFVLDLAGVPDVKPTLERYEGIYW